MSGRVHAGPALALLAAVVLSAGCASPGVQKADLFVTRDQRLVLSSHTLSSGEVIIHVENDDGSPHVVALARLEDGTPLDGLRVRNAVVPTGARSEQRYDGDGYRVIAKSDRMKAYFNGPNRVRTTFHVHLEPGRYVLFANSPGDYENGVHTDLTVTA